MASTHSALPASIRTTARLAVTTASGSKVALSSSTRDPIGVTPGSGVTPGASPGSGSAPVGSGCRCFTRPPPCADQTIAAAGCARVISRRRRTGRRRNGEPRVALSVTASSAATHVGDQVGRVLAARGEPDQARAGRRRPSAAGGRRVLRSPPKLVAEPTSRDAARNSPHRLLGRQGEPQHPVPAPHLPRRDRVRGVARDRPGQRTSDTAGMPEQQPRPARRRSSPAGPAAGPACPARGAPARPPSARAPRRPGCGPRAAGRPAPASRVLTCPSTTSPCPASALVSLRHDQVGAQLERPLAERGRGGVVHGQQRARRRAPPRRPRRCPRPPAPGWTGSPAAPAPPRRARRPATPPPSAPRAPSPRAGPARRGPATGPGSSRRTAAPARRRRAASPSTARIAAIPEANTHALAAVQLRRSPPPAPARSGCRPGRRSRAATGLAGEPEVERRGQHRPGVQRAPPARVRRARRARTASRRRDAVTSVRRRGARLISSLPISATESPSWQTRRTASAIGSSTPWRSPSAQIDEHDLTPSATWPWLASSACGSVSPRPSRSPNVRLRDSGDEQVATRSPSPASPAKVSGIGAERDPEPGRLGQPAGDQRRPRVVAEAHPGGHPAGQRDHVLAGPAHLAADHVGLGVGPEVAGAAGVLQGDRAVVVGAGDHGRPSAPRRRSPGPGSARSARRPGPGPPRRRRCTTSLIRAACPAPPPWPG